MQIGDRARTVHESNVFIALGLASSEKQIPQIVENIGNQIVNGAIRGDSGSLQAGGRRFDPDCLFPERFGVGQFLEPALLKPGKPAKSARKRAPGSAGSSAAGEGS